MYRFIYYVYVILFCMLNRRINQILDVLNSCYDKLEAPRGTHIDRIVCPAGMRWHKYESLCNKIARSQVALARYLGEGLDKFEDKKRPGD